jgi:uncharacterized protein (TIGR04255 family)
MAHEELKNKPLVEAIFEVRWALMQKQPGIKIDQHYKILLGRLYDKVSDDYPVHEQLDSAQIPDEIMGHTVQHRFRVGKDEWPLMQIGPGIMTINDTRKYTWPDFKQRSSIAFSKLCEFYPKKEDFKIESLLLRYIDAVDFDPNSNNILDFLKEKMRVDISLPTKLFGDGISQIPSLFNWNVSFKCDVPKGIVSLHFATGRREGRSALIWETLVQSNGIDLPSMPHEFEIWIESAHKITHDWFFTLIEGELERRFTGE